METFVGDPQPTRSCDIKKLKHVSLFKQKEELHQLQLLLFNRYGSCDASFRK